MYGDAQWPRLACAGRLEDRGAGPLRVPSVAALQGRISALGATWRWRARWCLLTACILAAVLAGPGTARAATLTNVGGTLTYSANAGHRNQVAFDEGPPGTVRVERFLLGDPLNDDDPISALGCVVNLPGDVYTCTAVTRVLADGGDGDDILDAAGVNRRSSGLTAAPSQLGGGPGDDTLNGGAQADTLTGGAGDDALTGKSGNDVLNGEEGDDTLVGDAGADTYSGGPGLDLARFSAEGNPPPNISVTLDGVNNDGLAGENDNVQADMEDIEAETSNQGPPGTPNGSVTLGGTAATNILTVKGGNGAITGGAGNDTLTGGASDDTIDARDGYADRVKCGKGGDSASVDTLDTVSADCETVAVGPVGALSLTLTVTPRRDRTVPFSFRSRGTLELPPMAPPALGCVSGVVNVQVHAGTKTISNRRVGLTRRCTYSSRVRFRDPRRFGPSGRLKFTARFNGNPVIQSTSSRSRRVSTR
jgi:Ca2+-binding RTX toxin-like protein